ncbi:hypothetical protein HQS1_29170 [Delftia lacustris]|nr:hypothetical protein HQS1_29170 [Delftia lacustris]
MLVTGLRSMSSRVITLMLAGASLMSTAVPEAVTTTVDKDVSALLSADWAWAMAVHARAAQSGRGRSTEILTIFVKFRMG